jgi:hypothetical protein
MTSLLGCRQICLVVALMATTFLGCAMTMRTETGRSFLTKDQREAPGYRLYSYLLLRGTPNSNNKDRYHEALKVYLEEIPEIEAYRHIARGDLNVTYVPVTGSHPVDRRITPEQLLKRYDFVRARDLLRRVPDATRDGPYIVSFNRPLSALNEELTRGELLLQDLSSVDPDLISHWVKTFMKQASRPGAFAKEDTNTMLALRIRTWLEDAATGLPKVEDAFKKVKDKWFEYVKPVEAGEPKTK